MEGQIEKISFGDLDMTSEGSMFIQLYEPAHIKWSEGLDTVTLTVKEYRKIPDEKFALSNADYKYQIETEDNRILDINAWRLHYGIRDAFKKFKGIEGAQLKITKPERGKYIVELLNSTPELIKVEE